MVIRRVGVVSAAKISGVLYAAMGLIFGLIVALISSAGAGILAATQSQGSQGWLGPIFVIGAIVFLPILYGVIGLIAGAISAALYNLFSGLVGGLELEVQ